MEVKLVPYRPSNGTEGDLFQAAFCARCKHDSEFREAFDRGAVTEGCGILARALAFDEDDPKFPKEWVIPEDSDCVPGDATCTAFEAIK